MGEVGKFIRGCGIQKRDLLLEGKPVIHYGELHTIYGVSALETRSFTAQQTYERSKRAASGDVIIATTSEDDEAVGKATVWLGDSPVAVSGDAHIYRHELEPRYVSYFFASQHFHSQKRKYLTGAKVRRISTKSLEKVLIPTRPMEEQKRIADILDRFDALVNDISIGLPAELEARRKQYEYYRDKLLTFMELPA